MSVFDEEPAKRESAHKLGQDLSLLSVDELSLRILELKAEIVRLETAIAAKGVTRDAAESLFRKG